MDKDTLTALGQIELFQKAKEGAKASLEATHRLVERAIAEKGAEALVGFSETAFPLPLPNVIWDVQIKSLLEMRPLIQRISALIKDADDLSSSLEAGLASLFSLELREAIQHLYKLSPPQGYFGFLSDVIYRSLGLPMVDGRIPGVCLFLGSCENAKTALAIVRELQSKNILTLITGESLKTQLEQENVSLGLENYLVPLGDEVSSLIFGVNLLVRAALSYGGLKKGDAEGISKHLREKIPAFALCLGELDSLTIAYLFGLMRLGIPVVTDQEAEGVKVCPTTLFEALTAEKDYQNIVSKGIQVRNIKVRVKKIDIPVSYSAAFEGERIRKEQMFVEFGGRKALAFEYLKAKGLEEIRDGSVELLGPDLDSLEEGKSYPLAVLVEVAGRKMQEDFEPVLERQIHRFFNYASGLQHLGQRDVIWVRISRDTRNLGLKLTDFGKILHAKFLDEYSNIVDKVAVKLITREDKIGEFLSEARQAYNRRNEKLNNLRDENVSEFYNCLLCSSFAPNHACVITPERSGLCGAISWLDAKTSYEISPTGGNRPVERKGLLDPLRGEWEGINEFIYSASHQTINRLCLYSIVHNPMTSCGCFECIAAILPEANGVIAVNREYGGMTPVGMKFSTLAGMTGGGQQTPGFIGVSRKYITSAKFIAADGGIKRLVWMPRELKEALAQALRERVKEIGIPDFIEKIADETIATEPAQLMEFLQKVNHPVLSMEPIM